MNAGISILSSHIYHEGNNCANKLANHGHDVTNFLWWDVLPAFISQYFFREWVGLPSYHFPYVSRSYWFCCFLLRVQVRSLPFLQFFLFLINFWSMVAYDGGDLVCQSNWDVLPPPNVFRCL